MSIDDYLTILTLTSSYKIRPTLEEVLDAAYRFSNDDLSKASDILQASPERRLIAFAASPGFGPALDRLIETAPDSRNRAVAFLKLGVPVRGLVLPYCVRGMIAADVHAAGGHLHVNGVPVDLAGMSSDQKKALLKLFERGAIYASPKAS